MTAILASPPSLAQIDHTVIGTWLGVGVGVGGIAVGVGIAFWQHRYNRRAAAKLDRAVADLEAAKNKARVAELEVQGLRSSLTSMAKGYGEDDPRTIALDAVSDSTRRRVVSVETTTQ